MQTSKARHTQHERKSKKYRVKIFMVKPFEFVDVWDERPYVDDVLEAFSSEVLTLNVNEYFKIEVHEV